MRILAIDCSSVVCSACLVEDETVLGEISLRARRSHATFLYRCLDQLMLNSGLRFEDLDGFGVTIGPGSFTGLRIGLAAAKGLAYAADKPLVGVSTLEALARNIPCSRLPLVVALDARKSQVYTARFDPGMNGESVRVGPERVLSPEELIAERHGKDTLFMGDGVLSIWRSVKGKIGTEGGFRTIHGALRAALRKWRDWLFHGCLPGDERTYSTYLPITFAGPKPRSDWKPLGRLDLARAIGAC